MIQFSDSLATLITAKWMKQKVFMAFFISFAFGTKASAQTNLACSYFGYSKPSAIIDPCLGEYYLKRTDSVTVTDSLNSSKKEKFYIKDVRDTVFIEYLDPFLKGLGLSRNFEVFRCVRNHLSNAFIANLGQGWQYHRSIFVPKESGQIFSNSVENILVSLSLFHAVGHHLMRHYFIEGITEPAMELEADRFSGFALARLTENSQEVLHSLNEWVSDVEERANFPADEFRIGAIKTGWEQGLKLKIFPFQREIPIFDLEPERVTFFWDSAKAADSLDEHEISAQHYLSAYGYSGGKNRVVLDEAFSQAKMAGNTELAIQIGKEYLKGGMDTKNRIGYKNLLLELSRLYQQASNPDEAMRYLEVSRKGDDYRTADMLAESRMLFRMGRFEESKEALTEAIRLGPATSEMYILLGEVSHELGDVQGAIRAFRGVLARSPDDVGAILGLASVYAGEALSISALEEQEPDKAEKARMGQAKTNLLRQAEEVLQEGLSERPGDEQLLMQLLRVYVLIPDEKGRREIKRALTKGQK